MSREETWYEKLGFKQNPFTIKPYAFGDELQGYNNQIKKIATGLKNGKVMFIEGEYGIGKTSVTKQIIDEFKGKRKLIYYSANRKEGEIDFDNLIKGRAGPIGKLFGIRPKGLVMIIDEAQKMNLHDAEEVEKLIKSKHFKSVVFISDDMNRVTLTNGLKRRIGKQVINLSNLLSDNMAFKIVKSRLGDNNNFLSKDIVKQVFDKAGKNPRKMLEYLEDVSRYAIEEKGAKKIKKEHVRYVLA